MIRRGFHALPGPLALPGNYSVSIAKRVNGMLTELGQQQDFAVNSIVERGLAGASHEETVAFNLRIESFAQDPRSLFLENQGSFGPTVGPQGLDALTSNIRATYEFLIEKAVAFLGPFDAHHEA